MPQDLLVGVLGLEVVGEFLLGLSGRQPEMLREPLDVGLGHFDARMAAAVPGALGTVESVLQAGLLVDNRAAL
jgi:hypothetical protein